MTDRAADIAVLGGGLAGGLIALALARLRPDVTVRLIERDGALGGNHVWSFFASDLPPGAEALLEPLVAARWDGYTVAFPAHTRTLGARYRSITSERFDAALRRILAPGTVLTGRTVAGLAMAPDGSGAIHLADGETLHARAVIDARGAAYLPHLTGGWQKFVGQMLRMARPHGLEQPVVMDATVEQHDGYRFVYCLPFSATDVFVEDTYYANDPALDMPALAARIAAYAAGRGWEIAEIRAQETGVLPVLAGGDYAAFRTTVEAETAGRAALAGVRAGLFQPLTSYSLPTAVRFALFVAGQADLSGAGLAPASRAWARQHWQRAAFYRKLSTMLFGAAVPAERYRILQRFYGLDERLIERFYAGESTMTDKARILCGKPPVPLGMAAKAILGITPQGRLERKR